MTIRLSQIASLCGGRLVGTDMPVGEVLTDSRKLFVAGRTLFVALKGERHDGAHHVGELYSRGLRAFLCNEPFDVAACPEASFVLVADTLKALQQIASSNRQNSQARIVAICGSNGKTIVKEWLSQLIAGDRQTVRSPRSYNSQVGVPLSLLKIEETTELGIIEVGISMRGEMARLEEAVKPNDVIFTNIGQAHQENFVNLGEKLREKLVIGHKAERIFFCSDHKEVGVAIKRYCPNAQTVSWGTSTTADYQVAYVSQPNGMTIHIEHGLSHFDFQTRHSDPIFSENMTHALVYALAIGIPPEHLTERTPQIDNVGMRLEQKEGHNGCTIINDAYNADITSLEVSLDMLYMMGDKQGLSRTLILSDLQQTGIPDDALYERVARLLDEKGVSRLVGIGTHISAALGGRPASEFYDSTADFLSRVSMADFHNEAILLKGQRCFGFERIGEMLENLRNRTVMEVNLNALAHNIAYFRSFLKPTTKLLAMVKAYSYGTGSFEIAKLMQQQGVDYLGVAFADEGYDLRQSGITLPIAVMNPEPHSYDLMLKYDLEPQVNNMEMLEAYSDAVRKAGLESANIHVKFNTGMTRSGFEVDEATSVADAIKKAGNLHVVSAFSHLVESEDPTKDDGTRHQIALFSTACENLKNELGYGFIRHILNSAGIERFCESQFEMVRLGIGLYGLSALDNSRLRNVATLKSYISNVRHVKAGESVGYNRRTILKRDSLIAVVPIGYADGVDRRLSNGVGQVLIRGHFVPLAGNVCMDIIMVDVTDVPDVKAGDTVELFGDTAPVWEMSAKIGTICYEILTGIGRRVKRIYFVE